MGIWVDFTRRNDPACEAGAVLLERRLAECRTSGRWPDVLCFWSKNPAFLAARYCSLIREFQGNGTLVLAQITLNPGYQPFLEPGVNPAWWEGLGPLVRLLGEGAVRLRFDPVVKGFTTPAVFHRHLEIARRFGIAHTVANFLIPSYKGVGKLLAARGLPAGEFAEEEVVRILTRLVDMGARCGVRVAACAEWSHLVGTVAGLARASCSDPEWAAAFRPELKLSLRPSRKGCGCCYSDDWGVYRSRGGYACPHQCLYCYAR